MKYFKWDTVFLALLLASFLVIGRALSTAVLSVHCVPLSQELLDPTYRIILDSTNCNLAYHVVLPLMTAVILMFIFAIYRLRKHVILSINILLSIVTVMTAYVLTLISGNCPSELQGSLDSVHTPPYPVGCGLGSRFLEIAPVVLSLSIIVGIISLRKKGNNTLAFISISCSLALLLLVIFFHYS